MLKLYTNGGRITIMLLFVFLSSALFSQTVTIDISGIRNLKGNLQIAIFESQEQFYDEKPIKIINTDKEGVINGQKNAPLKLPPGLYAITVLDDEDQSGDMTYRLKIYPLEGVGFSNYTLTGMTKPKFSDFSFTVDDTDTNVKVKLKYF